jgi:hypothetical protein
LQASALGKGAGVFGQESGLGSAKVHDMPIGTFGPKHIDSISVLDRSLHPVVAACCRL